MPLRDLADLERWWTDKARAYGSAEGEALSEWSPRTSGTISREKDVPASASSIHSHIHMRRSGEYPREGRAERLAELEPAVYF